MNHTKTLSLHDVVALLEDLPEYGLRRGQVGVIVEAWTPDVYEVEFADVNGVAYAMVSVRAEQLLLLSWQSMTSHQRT